FGGGDGVPRTGDSGRALDVVAPTGVAGETEADAFGNERDRNRLQTLAVNHRRDTIAGAPSRIGIGHACNGNHPVRAESEAALVLHSIFAWSLAIVELVPKHRAVRRRVLGGEKIVVAFIPGIPRDDSVPAFVHHDGF